LPDSSWSARFPGVGISLVITLARLAAVNMPPVAQQPEITSPTLQVTGSTRKA
jgi:multidrug efflux pump subunit AcrB